MKIEKPRLNPSFFLERLECQENNQNVTQASNTLPNIGFEDLFGFSEDTNSDSTNKKRKKGSEKPNVAKKRLSYEI